MLSDKKWQTLSVIQLGVLIFFSIVGTVCMAEIATILARTRLTSNQLQLMRLVIWVFGVQGGAIVWIHFFLKHNHFTWGEAFGFSLHNYRQCMLVVIVGLVLALVGQIGLGALSYQALGILHKWLDWEFLKPQQQEAVQILQNEWPISFIVLQAIATLIIAPAAEELLFRGILYTAIKQRGHPQAALWVTSVLFALIHHNLVGFLALIFLAVLLVAVYERAKNLFAPILLHSLFNTVNFVLIVAQPKWAENLFKP